MGKRAYVNPIATFGEKEQRAFIEAKIGPMDEWYVESKTVTRADFVKHLRPGDEAVVARVGCLARPFKDGQRRMADLLEARGDIHERGAILVSAEGLRSDKKGHWPKMKEAAVAFFRWTKNLGNASARAHKYTDDQLRALLVIRVNKTLGSWDKRKAEIKRKGIPMCGRTWFIQMLPIVASRRGIEI